MTGLEQKEEEPVEHQLAQLTKTIQQLQQRIIDLELRTVPNTLQDVQDQQEAIARSVVERIKNLSMECK
jgi:hypothetical protein